MELLEHWLLTTCSFHSSLSHRKLGWPLLWGWFRWNCLCIDYIYMSSLSFTQKIRLTASLGVLLVELFVYLLHQHVTTLFHTEKGRLLEHFPLPLQPSSPTVAVCRASTVVSFLMAPPRFPPHLRSVASTIERNSQFGLTLMKFWQ